MVQQVNNSQIMECLNNDLKISTAAFSQLLQQVESEINAVPRVDGRPPPCSLCGGHLTMTDVSVPVHHPVTGEIICQQCYKSKTALKLLTAGVHPSCASYDPCPSSVPALFLMSQSESTSRSITVSTSHENVGTTSALSNRMENKAGDSPLSTSPTCSSHAASICQHFQLHCDKCSNHLSQEVLGVDLERFKIITYPACLDTAGHQNQYTKPAMALLLTRRRITSLLTLPLLVRKWDLTVKSSSSIDTCQFHGIPSSASKSSIALDPSYQIWWPSLDSTLFNVISSIRDAVKPLRKWVNVLSAIPQEISTGLQHKVRLARDVNGSEYAHPLVRLTYVMNHRYLPRLHYTISNIAITMNVMIKQREQILATFDYIIKRLGLTDIDATQRVRGEEKSAGNTSRDDSHDRPLHLQMLQEDLMLLQTLSGVRDILEKGDPLLRLLQSSMIETVFTQSNGVQDTITTINKCLQSLTPTPTEQKSIPSTQSVMSDNEDLTRETEKDNPTVSAVHHCEQLDNLLSHVGKRSHWEQVVATAVGQVPNVVLNRHTDKVLTDTLVRIKGIQSLKTEIEKRLCIHQVICRGQVEFDQALASFIDDTGTLQTPTLRSRHLVGVAVATGNPDALVLSAVYAMIRTHQIRLVNEALKKGATHPIAYYLLGDMTEGNIIYTDQAMFYFLYAIACKFVSPPFLLMKRPPPTSRHWGRLLSSLYHLFICIYVCLYMYVYMYLCMSIVCLLIIIQQPPFLSLSPSLYCSSS